MKSTKQYEVDSKGNVKTAMGLVSKTTTPQVLHAFLSMSQGHPTTVSS